jgi:hypothetical protein
MLSPSEQMFEEKLQVFEGLEGKILPMTIDSRYYDLCCARTEAKSRISPVVDLEFRQRMGYANTAVRTRSLYAYLMEFEQAGLEGPDSNIMVARAPADIMMDVETLRMCVSEMKLKAEQAKFFYDEINHYAKRQLKKSGKSELESEAILDESIPTDPNCPRPTLPTKGDKPVP